jgi:hypothetical protein
MQYSANQIIGKTLIAARPVQIKRTATDSAPAVFTVSAGNPVGVVFSYVAPGAGRSSIYWMFNDQYGRAYYAKHETGAFSLSALKNQGAITVKEETELEKAASITTADFFKKYAKTALWVIAGVLVARAVLPELIKKIK